MPHLSILETLSSLYPLWLLWGGMLVLALVFGSFANVLIYRLPLMLFAQNDSDPAQTEQLPEQMSLAWPSSHCPHCKTPLKWWQNIPLIGFLVQKGHCAHCQQGISWRYPAVELGSFFLMLMVLMKFGLTYDGLAWFVFFYLTMVLLVIDMLHFLLPDALVYCLLWLGLMRTAWLDASFLGEHVLAVVLSYMCLWILNYAYRVVRHQEGMGHGDFKLLAAIAAWIGLFSIPLVLMIASFAACAFYILLMLKRQQKLSSHMDMVIPFGPFLCFGAWVIILGF